MWGLAFDDAAQVASEITAADAMARRQVQESGVGAQSKRRRIGLHFISVLNEIACLMRPVVQRGTLLILSRCCKTTFQAPEGDL